MTTFVPPYTVTVDSTAHDMAQCSYVDGNGVSVPADTVLTTSTPRGLEGALAINFTETKVGGKSLRLVGAAVKTVDHDPTMTPANFLSATRTQSGTDEPWVDSIVVPWGVDMYTLRGVVLLFAEVNNKGDMVNFLPTTDPQTRNDDLTY